MLFQYCQPCLDTLCCFDTVNLVSTFYVALMLSTLSQLFMLPWCCQPNLVLNVALILSTLSRYFMLFWFCQPCIDNLCCLDTINLISIVYVVSIVNLVSILYVVLILSTLYRYFMLPWYCQFCIDTLLMWLLSIMGTKPVLRNNV